MYYSPSTGGFYTKAVHGFMPDDVIKVTDEEYAELRDGRASGMNINVGEDGRPYLAIKGLCADELAMQERAWRDAEIESVRWLRERHRDEVDSARPTTLTSGQSGELFDYVQSLRDWPQSPEFPAHDHRPIQPDWIAEQTR